MPPTERQTPSGHRTRPASAQPASHGPSAGARAGSADASPSGRSRKPAEWRRWLGIGLRTAHLVCVVLLGIHVATDHGHQGPAALAPGLTLATGVALALADRLDGRLFFRELAGAVVVLKLLAVAALARWPALGPPVYWSLLVLSGLSSHAPKPWRHWRPGRHR